MKNKIYMLLIILLISNGLFAQEYLNKYLEIAAKNNPALKAKFNEYKASLEKVPQVGTLPDPQLTFGYFIMPVETKNGPQKAKVSIAQKFPWIGTLKSRENVYVFAAKSKYEDFKEAKSKLFFEVKSNYYELYFIKKGIDITRENISILETLKKLALIKIENSLATSVDVLRIEMELADLENNLAQLKDRWNVSSIKFNNLLNLDTNTTIHLSDKIWTNDLIYTKQQILMKLNQQNHQLKSFDMMISSYVYDQKEKKKRGLPNITLGMDYTSIDDNGNFYNNGKDALMVKIGITVPLYRKKYSAMIKEAVFHQKIVKNKKINTANILKNLLEKSFAEYLDANRRIVLYKKQRKLADRARKILETNYSSQGKNFEEVLRMQKKNLKYSLELQRAQADKQVAIAFIHYLMGE
jgi:outer membrane protein TolC